MKLEETSKLKWKNLLTENILAKKSFNADTEMIRGIGGLAFQALKLYYDTDESKEGVQALNEKRKPNFRRHFDK